MPALARTGLAIFIVSAAGLLAACSSDESTITEAEDSVAAIQDTSDQPLANNDSASDLIAGDGSGSDASTDVGGAEAATGPSTTIGATPTSAGPTASSTSISVDSSTGGSDSTTSSGTGSTSSTTGGATTGGETTGSATTGGETTGSATSGSATTGGETIDSGAVGTSTGSTIGGISSAGGTAGDSGADAPGADVDAPPADRSQIAVPQSELFDLTDGSSTELADEVDGQLTLIWFWSTDTSTSEREAVVAQRFAEQFAGSVEVLAVGSEGERSEAEDFYQSSNLDVTTLWSPDGDAAAYYDVESLPTSLLVDGSGNIIGRWPGLPEEAFQLAERIT